MWTWIANIAALFTGLSAAATLSETLDKRHERKRRMRQLKRGMILPQEAAKELQHQIGGRVAVGQDLHGHLLVVMRTRRGAVVPTNFAGYRVRRQPKLTLVED